MPLDSAERRRTQVRRKCLRAEFRILRESLGQGGSPLWQEPVADHRLPNPAVLRMSHERRDEFPRARHRSVEPTHEAPRPRLKVGTHHRFDEARVLHSSLVRKQVPWLNLLETQLKTIIPPQPLVDTRNPHNPLLFLFFVEIHGIIYNNLRMHYLIRLIQSISISINVFIP